MCVFLLVLDFLSSGGFLGSRVWWRFFFHVFVVVVVEVCGFWNLGLRSFQNSVVWIGCLLFFENCCVCVSECVCLLSI